jgi:hypothetical protein
MEELINQITHSIEDLKACNGVFAAEKVRIERDMSIIGQELSGIRNDADQKFIVSLGKTLGYYSDVIYIVFSAKQQLEEIKSKLQGG